jgi:glycosyltransferase involved in cell wall biosynthesis
MFSLGLIINTHEQPEYLARVLGAVSRQISAPEEVLLADDGSGEQTKRVYAEWSPGHSLHAEHVWQPHEGFRRARILNEAIARARSDYLVFLDGDTLPHPQFAADHRRLGRRGAFIQGHRALIKERAAAWFGLDQFGRDRRRALWQGQLEGLKHAFRLPLPLLRTSSSLRGIRGCNLGIWRDDLIRVNGYNEDFVGWGREDSELAVRLMNTGVRRWDVRGRALCYHLWHPPASRAGVPGNDELLAAAIAGCAVRCVNGLQQHLKPSPPRTNSAVTEP